MLPHAQVLPSRQKTSANSLMSAACLAATTIPDTLVRGEEFDQLGPKSFQNHRLKGCAEWLSESL